METQHSTTLPDWNQMADAQQDRWATVLSTLAAAIPAGAASVVIDGRHADALADRLADTLRQAGRQSIRLTENNAAADEDTWHVERTPTTVAIASGPHWRTNPHTDNWDLTIWLRTRDAQPKPSRDRDEDQDAFHTADIVLDLDDPTWPIIRRVHPRIAAASGWYIAESQAFFAPRAATWDSKFGDDMPAYAAAVAELDPQPGAVALDLGCGTGRALPALREAVGLSGTVIALDLTPHMLEATRAADRAHHAALMLADAHHLPLADASVDAVFAAGLLNHLHDLPAGLRELARVTRPAARLAIYHPTGRAALAARHGRTLRPDEPLAEDQLGRSLAETGWTLTSYQDSSHRFLAVATRRA
jgi:SAM-dependent methyltransferase